MCCVCAELAKRMAGASIPVRVDRYEERKWPSNTALDAAPPHRVLEGPVRPRNLVVFSFSLSVCLSVCMSL